MSMIALLKSEQNSVEFYTEEATGNSGISQSGLAKLNGVSRQAIIKLEETLVTYEASESPKEPPSEPLTLVTNPQETLVRSEVPEWLKPLAGKVFTLVRDTDQAVVNGKNAGNLKIYNAAFSVAVTKHYADKGNKAAVYSLMKFAEMGFDTWVQTVTGWNAQPQQPDQSPDIDRALVGEINTLHAQIEATNERAKRDHLQLAKAIGDRLLQLKATIKHGQWGRWRYSNFSHISERSLQIYMRISKRWDEIVAAEVETLRDADKLLRRYVTPRAPKLQPIALTQLQPHTQLADFMAAGVKAGIDPRLVLEVSADRFCTTATQPRPVAITEIASPPQTASLKRLPQHRSVAITRTLEQALSESCQRILKVLSPHEGLTAVAVAELAGISPSNARRSLVFLWRKKLVQREAVRDASVAGRHFVYRKVETTR